MALRELFTDSFLSIRHDADAGCLHADWRGELSLPVVQNGCRVLQDLMVSNQAYTILNLNIDVQSIEARAAEWSAHQWFPDMRRAGLRHFAWVYGPTRLLQFANATRLSLEDAGKLGIKIFFDKQQALDWLRRVERDVEADARQPLALVIEDNRDFSQLFRDMLQIMGCRTLAAYGARAGLELAIANQPDLIFCDLGLPGDMDGLQFARAAAVEPRLAQTALIAVSGRIMDHEKREALQAGFRRFLAKPVKFAEVDDALSSFSSVKRIRPAR
jgi:CheY-like chemotaxis protein